MAGRHALRLGVPAIDLQPKVREVFDENSDLGYNG